MLQITIHVKLACATTLILYAQFMRKVRFRFKAGGIYQANLLA